MEEKAAVLTGKHFWSGDIAVAEGGIAAGCRFFAGYPITPATEVAERMSERLPALENGVFIQMEDEIASMNALLGASWGGMKAMTSTSGPGFSLMMENLGLGIMLETPCVIANVQRGGPSTGLPTLVGQQDMMQARWGSHGDYEIIALCPNSPQECFDLTIQAFNFSEMYRVPVLLMTDEVVGHMYEKVIVPLEEDIELVTRPRPKPGANGYLPYAIDEESYIPPMGLAGEGFRLHVTGLTHDERGYPAVNAETQGIMVPRLVEKIKRNAPKIYMYEEDRMDDAEVVVLSFGCASRIAKWATFQLRERGRKVGFFRLITAWPFPEPRVRQIAEQVKGIVVVETNLGQMVREVERVVAGRCQVKLAPNAGGRVHETEEVTSLVEEILR
ncbi:2-oxoacid:acceptor oxidoreductase subunit alpha [bacterium]|nr:2-oxoacid:acceptor oxidoreductase subunit alpha [bacterium]MBU1984254.1 2-oxoacid:acceptor oxidoreductase subunit alpha [bacterium]